MDNLDSTTIAAGMFGSVTLGTLVMLLLQQVKAFWPTLAGRQAEAANVAVSFVAVLLVVVAARSDWRALDTWLAIVIGTLGTTVIARGVYAQLFKVSVPGVPPPSDAEAIAVADSGSPDPAQEFGWRRERSSPGTG